ncbi:MAG TPA: ornithine carbamoyltransferase [Terriglobales bacterium]|nr:ornithine carbamoyltransferase [Terriglobales bacterium]
MSNSAATAASRKRDLASIQDFSPSEISNLLDLAADVKDNPGAYRRSLDGKQVVLFFEKPSLRTRLTFESGVNSLGGVSFFVDQTASRLGAREPLNDMAKNLERWVNGVVLRTFSHETVTKMAQYASIPVINALSDFEHPCQALADILTLRETFGDLRKLKLAYVGDGNNVAHSLMLAAASIGMNVSVGTPVGYEPSPNVVADARTIAATTGATVEVTNDPFAAVTGADAIYTDVWASMGQEDEAAERKRIFAPFQVNDELFAKAKPTAVFMHCLPAHRGDEVTASVIDSPRSVVYDEAENRLHIQKAILLFLLGGIGSPVSGGANA